MTVSEPVVAAVLGVAALGETLETGKAGRIGLLLAFIVMTLATGALARSEAVAETDEPATTR